MAFLAREIWRCLSSHDDCSFLFGRKIKSIASRGREAAARINKLPRWARDYIHNIETFVGAEEVRELTYLRDQKKALIKLVGELKTENKRLRKRLDRKR